MSNSLFGGGVLLTGALLLSSLNFYAQQPSTTQKPISNQDSQTQTQNPTTVNISHESEMLSGAVEADMPVIAEAATPKVAISAAPSSDKKTESEGVLSVAPQKFMATAYALRGRTASGHTVRRGLIAADHTLPLGTRVRLDAGSYSGEYLVADRGGRIRGRIIDIWVPSNGEAAKFGRRPVKLTVLSYGAKRPAKARK
jgi:3D (Asp-Asp-Asp) domain-containing protein